AQVLAVAAGPEQPGEDGVAQHEAAGTAVAAQEDATPLETGPQGRREGGGCFRRQALADDAANPRDTDDQAAHHCSPERKVGRRWGKRASLPHFPERPSRPSNPVADDTAKLPDREPHPHRQDMETAPRTQERRTRPTAPRRPGCRCFVLLFCYLALLAGCALNTPAI